MRINDHFKYLNIGLPEDILRRKMHGDFEGAIRLIDRKLVQDIPEAMRSCLIVQREIISRLEADYPYTKEEAIAIIREHIPDFEEAEFDERVDNGRIRWIYVDGEMRIFNRFFQSMVKADPTFAARAGVALPGVESAVNKNVLGLLDKSMIKMKEKGSLTNRIRVRTALKVKDEVFEKGMFIRAHLPIPAECEQQSEIVIEKVYPETGVCAPMDALQRTICWEEIMEENHEFYVEYSYIHKAVFHDTENMGPSDLEKARIFYDYITLNMKYTFMPAYFGLESIAETCARTGTGDCGVFALLFMTLCRCAGIPACWQSGLTAEPDFCGAHDWVRFYVAPHGWMYADTSYGTAAARLEKEERRKFYFGNLDPYRMVANNEFMAPFTIDKDHWRADPYDNQFGEMETRERGLRYSEFSYSKETLLCEEIE